jgi:hypothetical protein
VSTELRVESGTEVADTDVTGVDIERVDHAIRWAKLHRAVALGGLAAVSINYLAQDQSAADSGNMTFNQQNFGGLIESLDRPTGLFVIGMAVVAHRVKVGLDGYRAHLVRSGIRPAGKHKA